MSEISVVVVGSTSINSVVGNGDTVNVNVGNQTIGGGNGAAATIEVGTVATLEATQAATIVNAGTAYAAKFNFALPRGFTGSSGPANSLSIGSVSTGTTAAVSISGTSPSQSLSFVLQPGPVGPANSLSISSVSTGTTAAVSISGTAPSQSLSFVLPQGPQGPVTTLKIGTVVTGVDAAATLTGTGLTQTLNLVLPQGATGVQGIQGIQGEAGPANSLSVGSVSITTAATAAVSITGSAPSQQISFVIPQGPQGPQGEGGPYTTVQVGSVATGAAGSSAKIDTVTSGGTVTLNFTIPRGADGSSNLADETPQPLGVASAGSALTAARADHVHAVPVISYANLTNVPLTFDPAAHQHAINDVTGLQTALDGKQVAGSYPTLDGSGKISSAFLPSFVDDVREAAGLSAFPAQGDSGVIYVAVDTRKIYRWSGSTYVEISPSPGTTTDVPEGTNLYHTTLRAAAAAPVQSVAGRTGTITLAQLGSSGTASSTTFLRGDGAWSEAGSTDASSLTSGTVASARLPIATTTAAGAVIVGSGLAIASGVLSATGGSGGDVDGGVYAAPAAPSGNDPLWSSVRLLMPLDTNTNDFRSGAGSTVTAFGNAAIATSSPKFGAGSLLLDGNGDYLQIVDGLNEIVSGTGDFTLEMWVRPAALLIEGQYLFDTRASQIAGYGVYLTSSSTIVYSESALVTGSALTAGQWQHVAVCRASGTLRLFVNGSVAGSPVANTTDFASNRIFLGRSFADLSPYWFDGSIDDVRYTSAARYTATFTPPTSANPAS